MGDSGTDSPFNANQNDMVMRGYNAEGTGGEGNNPPVPRLPAAPIPETIVNNENANPNSNNSSVYSNLSTESANEHYLRSLQESGLKTTRAYVMSMVKGKVKKKLFKKMKMYKTPKSSKTLQEKAEYVKMLREFMEKEIPGLEVTPGSLWDEIQKTATVTLRQRRCSAVEQVKRLFFGKKK